MRRLSFFLVLAAAAVSQANINSTGVFANALSENFDSIGPQQFAASLFFPPPVTCTAYALNNGMIHISVPQPPQSPAVSWPNALKGVGTDIAFRVAPSMKRFGGYFRSAPNMLGVGPTSVKFAFYDASGGLIGSQGGVLTNNWAWFGFMVNPKFSRVEIYGNVVGGVEMDDLRLRQN